MNSPFTGGRVSLHQENAELTFRKEKFAYAHLTYLCEDTKEQFTTTELDEINLAQIHNQYRTKYGIPFPDEIRQIRQSYELSAAKISEILGFGDNQYRLYENGDIPSEANGKILSSIKSPAVFRVFVENARNQFESKEYEKIQAKLQKAIANKHTDIREQLIFEAYQRGACNGYAPRSCNKLKNVMLYLLEQCGDTFTTKMNKLLFYTDFFSYKTYGCGITGLAYKAIQYGPVPVHWDRVYSLMDDISAEEIIFPSGQSGIQLRSTLSPDNDCFSEKELHILRTIVKHFKQTSAKEISELSHKEDAWKKYQGKNQLIDFKEAFTLNMI